MRPIIGITSRYDQQARHLNLPDAYVKSVQRAGGTPVVLPPLPDIDQAQLLDLVDGLILTGGPDVDPLLYGEEPIPQQGQIDPLRDGFEISLARLALESKKPVLAICRGEQVLNVALGGTLIQDTNTQVERPLKHRQEAPASHGTHTVNLRKGSRLHGIFGKEAITTNSFHHQAVKTLGKGLVATGWAADAVIEAYEAQTEQFVMGVQWHPEHMSEGEMGKLFADFVAHCPRDSRTM